MHIHHGDFLFDDRTEDGTLTGRWSTESCIRISDESSEESESAEESNEESRSAEEGEVKNRVICECSTLSSRYAVLREQPEEKEVCR